MMPAIELRPVRVGDDDDRIVERVGAPVEGDDLFAVPRAADGEIALDLRGVEDVQRPAAVVGDVVGDVDEGVDRAQPDRGEAPLHPRRRGAVLHAAHEPEREGRAEMLVARLEGEGDGDGAGAGALHRLHGVALELAEAGRREIAGDAVDRGAVGPVRRQVDLDDRVIEPGIGRVGLPDGRVLGQVDDALVVVGELKLRFGAPACPGSRRRGSCRRRA